MKTDEDEDEEEGGNRCDCSESHVGTSVPVCIHVSQLQNQHVSIGREMAANCRSSGNRAMVKVSCDFVFGAV